MGRSLDGRLAAQPPKVSPPRAHEGVVWTRLQAGLDKCANARSLWLYAGPGAGKTQGLRQWLSVRKEPFAWFQIDPNDHDPIRVMYYLQHAVRALPVDPQCLTPFDPTLHLDIRMYAELWFRQIDAALPRRSYLVLDDLHLLGEVVTEHPVLCELLCGHFERLCVVVISRSSPAGQRLPPASAFTILAPEYFALRAQEIRELLLQRGIESSSIGPQRLAQIEKSSGGWVAAIRLLKALPEPESSGELEYDELLFRLMKSELLEPLSLVAQKAIRNLSYVASFSLVMMDALDPSGEAREAILRLCHENQFVVALEQADPPSYRFHPLLREALGRIEQQSSPLGIDRDCAGLLIQTCLAERRFADALDLMIRVEDWDAFIQWLSFAGLMLLQRGERASLKALLDRLPQAQWERQSTPRLKLLYGGSMTYSHSGQAMALLEQALSECRASDIHGLDLALTICLGVEAVLGAGENAMRLMPFWEALVATSERGFGSDIPDELHFRLALMANLLIIVCDPRNDASEYWMNRVQVLAEKVKIESELGRTITFSLAILMTLWASHGYLHKAKTLEPVFNRLTNEIPGRTSQLALNMVGFTNAMVQGRFPRAFELYEEGEVISKEIGATSWKLSITTMAAAIAAGLRDVERLESLMASLGKIRQGSDQVGRFNRAMFAASIEGAKGNVPEAIREFKLARDLVDRSGHRVMGITCRCALSAVHARVDKFPEAELYLEEAQAISSEHGIVVGDWAVWVTRAYLAYQRKDRATCHHWLAKALASLKAADYWTFPISWVGYYADLLVEALDADIERDFVCEMIRRNERYSLGRPHPLWPAKYELACLGAGELFVDGQIADDTFSPGNGLYELVMALMWFGGRDVADHRVMALLWPGTSTGKNPLHQSLKRLRQNFKRSQAVIYDSGRLSLHPGMWKVDLWDVEQELEDLVRQCVTGSSHAEQKAQLHERLANLRVRCEQGFASAQAMPMSLRSLAAKSAAPLIPEHLQRSLKAAKDALLDG